HLRARLHASFEACLKCACLPAYELNLLLVCRPGWFDYHRAFPLFDRSRDCGVDSEPPSHCNYELARLCIEVTLALQVGTERFNELRDSARFCVVVLFALQRLLAC